MSPGIKRTMRAALAGSLLLGGALTAVVIGGAMPGSAATVVNTIGVGVTPDGVSSDSTHVWVTNFGANTVTELDASDGSVVQTIGVGLDPYGISSDGTHVWVANSGGNTITELNASTGSVVQTIPDIGGPFGVSSDGTHVWVANNFGDSVTELNASDGSVVQTIAVGAGARSVSSDGTHVWVPHFAANTVTELNASDGSVVQTIGVGVGPWAVSSDGTHVWVANSGSSNVTELNASDGSVVQTIGVAGFPFGVSSDGTHVWVTNARSTLTELNASDGSVIQTIGVGEGSYGVSSDRTHVWEANANDNTVTEVAIKAAQVLAFTSTNPSPVVVGGPAYTPMVTGGASTSPVVVALDLFSTGCTLVDGVAQFTAIGTCILDANQAGDANYTAALQVQQQITINPPLCNSGTFSVTGASPCTPAPPGTYVGTTGAMAATDCGLGTYSSVSGATSCTPAPPNTYVATAGATAPTFCPAGTVNPNSGSISVAACVPLPFRISTTSLPGATPGAPYSPVTLQAAGEGTSTSPNTTTLKWKKVVLSKGLKLSAAGVLSGTPNAKLATPTSGTVQVTETVTTLNGKKKVRTRTTVQATIPFV